MTRAARGLGRGARTASKGSKTNAGEGAPLPKRAQNLLDAAERLLVTRGLSALTVDNVAEEAGEYRASIRYYFGNKRGLVAALVDMLMARSATYAAIEVAQRNPPGLERVGAQIFAWQPQAEDAQATQALQEVWPYVLRDAELRVKMAELYRWYRDIDQSLYAEGLEDADQDDLRSLASIQTAAFDGIALQKLLDPDAVDLDRCLRVLQHAVHLYLENLRRQDSPRG
jgi:AcrR family transcriptional regulator